jgi:hypothetical protein
VAKPEAGGDMHLVIRGPVIAAEPTADHGGRDASAGQW